MLLAWYNAIMDIKKEAEDHKRAEFKADNNIGKLKRRMYSRERKGFLPWRRRRDINLSSAKVGDDWEYVGDDNKERSKAKSKSPNSKSTTTILIFSIAFFVFASIGAVVYLSKAVDSKISGVVDIAIEGSSTIESGGVLELQVLITNRNDSRLELADIIVEYPGGTLSPIDFRTSLLNERIPLGIVEPRSARRGAIRAVMLGNEGDLQNIKVELQYRLKGSNAIHSRRTSHAVLMSSNAIDISVEANREVTLGQNIPIEITVKSQSKTILNDVYLRTSYPFGFSISDSSPAPVDTSGDPGDDSIWLLGSLRPGEERVVQLSGILDGQEGDTRIINIRAGSGIIESDINGQQEEIGTVLASAEHVIVVHKPFLSVNLEVNGESINKYSALSGKGFDVVVNWRNNLGVAINDAIIAVEIGGLALNKSGVNAGPDGFYRSVNSALLWDSTTTAGKLKNIAPGVSGKFKFKITPLPQSYLEGRRTPSLTFTLHAAGKRFGEGGVPETLREDSFSEVKIGTDASFSSYGLFRSSPFGKLGTLPPKVEYETSYGIVWEVSNTTNDLEDVIVRAELPHYVRWPGITTPASEQIIYNKVDRTLEWHLGSVRAGAGVSSTSRKVSFAVGLVPSATQIGQTPDLVRNQTLEAVDTYTHKKVEAQSNNVNTRIVKDEGYISEDATVIK